MRVQVQVDHRTEYQTESQIYMLTLTLPHCSIKSEIQKGMHLCLRDIQSQLPKNMVYNEKLRLIICQEIAFLLEL